MELSMELPMENPVKPPVISLARLAPEAIMQELEARYQVHCLPPEKLAQLPARSACRVLVTTGALGARREWLEQLPALALVSVYGVGLDAVDLDYCQRRGIQVTFTPGVLTESVADLALGLLLSASRRIAEGDRFVRAGHWQNGKLGLGWSLRKRKLGLLGYGRIGQEIARLASAFEMEILYSDRNAHPECPGRFIADPVELARQADALVVACAGGPATAGLVNYAVLEALGPDGLLVNVARGSVVDEAALIKALENNVLGAAALDVFADEPRVPAELLQHPRLVLTPHIASATDQARTAMGRLVLDNIAAFMAGTPLLTPVQEAAA